MAETAAETSKREINVTKHFSTIGDHTVTAVIEREGTPFERVSLWDAGDMLFGIAKTTGPHTAKSIEMLLDAYYKGRADGDLGGKIAKAAEIRRALEID